MNHNHEEMNEKTWIKKKRVMREKVEKSVEYWIT